MDFKKMYSLLAGKAEWKRKTKADVTVFEMTECSAFATDFQRIKNLKAAVKYKM